MLNFAKESNYQLLSTSIWRPIQPHAHLPSINDPREREQVLRTLSASEAVILLNAEGNIQSLNNSGDAISS